MSADLLRLLPDTHFGEPAKRHTPHMHRYVQALVALANGSSKVFDALQRSGSVEIDDILKGVTMAQMPRGAGLVQLNSSGLTASVDLMAAQIGTESLEVRPALKSSVDPDTKQVRASGLVIMSQFVVTNDLKLITRSVTPFAEAFNPDDEPWKADHYMREGQRLKQNEHGIAVASLDVLAVAAATRGAVLLDPSAGSTAVILD